MTAVLIDWMAGAAHAGTQPMLAINSSVNRRTTHLIDDNGDRPLVLLFNSTVLSRSIFVPARP